MTENIGTKTVKRSNRFVRWLAQIGDSFVSFFKKIGNFFVGLWQTVRYGNWKTRLSLLIMGFGCFAYGQPLRGALYLLLEIGFVLFMVFTGSYYLSKFGTLGTNLSEPVIDPITGLPTNERTPGDDSLAILLFGVATIMIILVFVFCWCVLSFLFLY